jgi:hypothetical protein
MKILALDIDGVLNSGKYLKQCQLEDCEGCLLDKSKLDIIKVVLMKNSEVRIIMNSSWNSTMDLEAYKHLFLNNDMDFPVDKIIDVTNSNQDKSHALESWLKKNSVTNFLVIDDDVLFDLSHPYHEYQLKTSYYIGLVPEHEEIILESFTVPFELI